MKDDKILDRIRKLLAMAGDTSSPNEAMIAANRARMLMDKHQVSELDLKTSAPEDFGTARHSYMDSWSGVLAVSMAWLNDCNVRQVTGKRGAMMVEFQGYLVDTVTAKELYLYLLAQAEVQSQAIKGRKAAFKSGFASGIQAQVKEILKEREQIKMSDGTSLVVSKKAMVTERFGAMQTSRARAATGNGYDAGYQAGKNTGLNRQVSGRGQARLTG